MGPPAAPDFLCLPAYDHLGEKSDVRVPTGVVATSTMDGPNRASVCLASYTVSGLPAYVHLNGFASTLLKYSMNASSRSLSSAFPLKLPRRSKRRDKMLNQIST